MYSKETLSSWGSALNSSKIFLFKSENLIYKVLYSLLVLNQVDFLFKYSIILLVQSEYKTQCPKVQMESFTIYISIRQGLTILTASLNMFRVINIIFINKSYDDSVKLKRTEMNPFRLGLGLG